jgi:hypothetical protein
LCTSGTPVADMLTHSPPLPLTISYPAISHKATAKDEEGILLALQHRDRVRHIRLALPASSLQKVITVMDEPFPILERMHIESETDDDDDAGLALPKTFQAPLIRHFRLDTVALPIGSPLLMTTAGLVTLELANIPSSAYFPPSYLLARLPLMPQLVKLSIEFRSPIPSRNIESQLSSTSLMTDITLPNLSKFWFRGWSTYLEGLLARIRAPLLSIFAIEFFNQLTFAIPHLSQFMRTSQNFDLRAIRLNFCSDRFIMKMANLEPYSSFYMKIKCGHLDWQVSSAEQILSGLDTIVEELILCHEEFTTTSSEWHTEVDRTQWRDLLRPFGNMEILGVQNEFVEELGRSLHSDDEEMPLDILSNLKELRFPEGSKNDAACRRFIEQRQAAGHPVNPRRVDISWWEEWRRRERDRL